MQNVLVTITTTDTPLPPGVVFGHTNLDVTDSAGAKQSFALSGSETPPWSQLVAGLADGVVTAVVQAVDSKGASIGSPITQTYTPVPLTFPAPTAIVITPAA